MKDYFDEKPKMRCYGCERVRKLETKKAMKNKKKSNHKYNEPKYTKSRLSNNFRSSYE